MTTNEKLITDFLKAAETGDTEKLIYLLESSDMDINAANDEGRTALHMASISHNIEALELLLEYNPNVNAQDEDGATPLHFAVKGNMLPLEVIELLLEHGADPHIKNEGGVVPSELTSNQKIKELLDAY